MKTRSTSALFAAVAVLVFALTGCGGSGDGTPPGNLASEDPGIVHVHGLGVDPGDSAVLLATHTGLFRLAEGDDRARRVGTLRQDTMGFTVTGPGRYLGSGHPDLSTGQPPLLGLISSADGGRTWSSVSLLGKADFHILRAEGRRVVGMDSQTGSVFVSANAGKRWVTHTPPGELVDLVLDPSDPDRILASTAAGLVVSSDAGRTWETAPGGPGYLAWPGEEALFSLGPDGRVGFSGDGGRSWERRGAVGGEPSAFTAVDPSRLLATTHGGDLMESGDGGATWALRAALE